MAVQRGFRSDDRFVNHPGTPLGEGIASGACQGLRPLLTAERRVEQERRAKEQEHQARIAAERQVAQLLARLKQAGIEP